MLKSSRLIVVAMATILAAAGCGSDEKADPKPTASVPAGFDVPEGVTLSPEGTTVKVGEPATFVYEVGDGAASAVTAKVEAVRKGDIKDFEFFTLDAATKKATPYYVVATVTNNGPAGLGGVSPPFVVHDNQNSIAAPNALNGSFKPCEPRALPATLLPGKSAAVCMVFLMPEGRSITSIDAVASDPAKTISWTP